MNLALIPLRGGSKSIPQKNIKTIAGKPLCAWVLEAARKANIFDQIVVSTDSDEIAGVVTSLDQGIEILKRPAHLATDQASTESVMLHAAEYYSFESITTIQATSPLVRADDFIEAHHKFNNEGYDSLLSAVRMKKFFWNADGTAVNYNPAHRPRRQEFQGTLMENGAFYITSRDILEQYKCRLGGRIGIYEMPAESATELDEPADWLIVEALLNKKKESAVCKNLNEIKLLAFDCDGVLTDAGMYYSESGEELKKFNARDGQGLALIRNRGIKTALITGENSLAAQRRAEKLKIDAVYLGAKDKGIIMQQLLEKYKIKNNNVVYLADDLGDLPAMELAGISFAVNDAVEVVKKKADYILSKKGGEGALRELCDLIINRGE